MRGYVKNIDEHILYKLDLPADREHTLNLNEGEFFVSVETVEALDAIEVEPPSETDDEKRVKLIRKKMRELAITELKTEGKLDENENLIE